jgi:hypothetical protein
LRLRVSFQWKSTSTACLQTACTSASFFFQPALRSASSWVRSASSLRYGFFFFQPALRSASSWVRSASS